MDFYGRSSKLRRYENRDVVFETKCFFVRGQSCSGTAVRLRKRRAEHPARRGLRRGTGRAGRGHYWPPVGPQSGRVGHRRRGRGTRRRPDWQFHGPKATPAASASPPTAARGRGGATPPFARGRNPIAAGAAGGSCFAGSRSGLCLGFRVLELAGRVGMGAGQLDGSTPTGRDLGARALDAAPARLDLDGRPLAIRQRDSGRQPSPLRIATSSERGRLSTAGSGA